MTDQQYTADMVTDETVTEFWRIYRANSQTEVSPCTKTALRAVMAPLWAEVQQLREAKRELVEALLPLASYTAPDNPQGNTGLYAIKYQHIVTARETLAKHGGGHE